MNRRGLILVLLILLSATEGSWQRVLPLSLNHLLIPVALLLPEYKASLILAFYSSFWEVVAGRGFIGSAILLFLLALLLRETLGIFVNIRSPILIPLVISGAELIRYLLFLWFSTLYHVHVPSFPLKHLFVETAGGTFIVLSILYLWRRSVPPTFEEVQR